MGRWTDKRRIRCSRIGTGIETECRYADSDIPDLYSGSEAFVVKVVSLWCTALLIRAMTCTIQAALRIVIISV